MSKKVVVYMLAVVRFIRIIKDYQGLSMRLWKLSLVSVLSAVTVAGCGGGNGSSGLTTPQDEGRIYFQDNFSIVQARPDGSAKKVVAPNSREVSVSRDGKKITYASRKEGSQAIYVADSNGTNEKRLIFARGSQVPIGGDIANPSFSPDGKQIVYEGIDENSPTKGIYIINIEGGPQRRIAGTQVVARPFKPIFTPDGKNI
ncbi:MAG TPA: hypothetical protein VF719_11465, partial [Abditibacteriaceae bacterium]